MGSLRSRVITAAGLAALALAAPASLAQPADTTPPRVVGLSPLPAGRIVDNVGVRTMAVRFDEDVTVPAGAVRVWGLAAGDLAIEPLAYDPATRTLTVQLAQPVLNDVVTLVIDYTVTDAAGNELDGEVASATALAFPSGDGVRGGRFVARFEALQGDADRDGATDGDDATVVRDSLGKLVGDEGFDPRADLNLDGVVNVLDVAIWASGLGLTLTTDDGSAPTLVGVTPDPAAALIADAPQIVLAFDQAVDPARVGVRDLFVVGASGLRIADAVAVDTEARTASFTFDPPLSRCDRYRVGVSNAFADASGALVNRPVTNPTLDGLLPPSQPTLDPLPEITSQQIVTVSGATFGASQVRVVGPEDVYLVPAVDGRFTAEVELPTDFVHTLYVSAVSPCGPTSAPTTARITRDTSGPVIHVDFPLPGHQITTPTVNVLGRLTDEFSGSKGLSATVNGITAAVDPAGGGNAVFSASKVNLEVGLNDIVVVATDTLGNSRTKTVSVERVIVPEGTPTIELYGGDEQTGPVLAELSRPIEVLLKRPDGQPLANKVVTFTVDRNDGRLGATAGSAESGGVMLQVFTDSSGIARAFWRLGSTAGAAANRVNVVSQDLVGTVYFTATGQGAPASRILVGDMNNQKAEAGAPLPQPLFAYVTDGDAGNPVPGVPVTFTVVQGNGSLAGKPTITVPTGLDGRAVANFTLGNTPGVNLVEATFEGNPGLPAVFSAMGVARVEGGQTTLLGLALDNANRPIGGALCTLTITLDFPSGPDTVILGPVTSGVDGRFTFDSSVIPEGALNDTLPGGPCKVLVSGVYATSLNGEPITREWTFPYVGYEIVLVQGAANTLQDPVWLPELDPANEVVYDGTQDVVLRVAGIDGLEFRVKAGSLTREDGTRPTPKDPEVLRLNQVHFDEVPMPLPNGNAFPFAWTLQPKNARFDPPIEVTLPNLTGLPPGSVAQILQWNNDVAEFQAMGTGKVSADGSVIVSEPGSGITVAGWGAINPPPPPTGGVCKGSDVPDCETECGADGELCCTNPVPALHRRRPDSCSTEPIVCGDGVIQFGFLTDLFNHPVAFSSRGIQSQVAIALNNGDYARPGDVPGQARQRANAHQHTWWQAVLTRRFGRWTAQDWGDRHEMDENGVARSRNRLVNDLLVDLHNNEIGRRLAEANPGVTIAQLRQLALDAVENGEARPEGPQVGVDPLLAPPHPGAPEPPLLSDDVQEMIMATIP